MSSSWAIVGLLPDENKPALVVATVVAGRISESVTLLISLTAFLTRSRNSRLKLMSAFQNRQRPSASARLVLSDVQGSLLLAKFGIVAGFVAGLLAIGRAFAVAHEVELLLMFQGKGAGEFSQVGHDFIAAACDVKVATDLSRFIWCRWDRVVLSVTLAVP